MKNLSEKIKQLSWLNIFIVLAVLFCFLKNELNILTLATLVVGIWALVGGEKKMFNIAIGLGIITFVWGFFAAMRFEEEKVPLNIVLAIAIGLLISIITAVVKEREEKLP
jgi:hypothetical protein